MSRKIKVTIICSVILLFSSNLNATEAASKIPVDTKATKEIVKEIDSLASNDIPVSVVFAKELVKVLSKYNVPVSDSLAGLKTPELMTPEPNEAQLEKLYETSNKISSTCRDSAWIKDPNYAVPVSLRNDLLVIIVNHCPHSLARLEAARWLAERAFPDEEMPEHKPDVSIELADTVCMSAINQVLSIPPKDDAIYFLSLGFGADLTLKHAALANEAGKQFNGGEVDKIFTVLNSRIKSVREIAIEKDNIILLDRFEESLSDVEKQIEQLAQIGSVRQELVPVVKGFLNAANKEDKEKIKQYFTEDTFKYLEKSESLRKDFSQLPDVKEMKFQSIGAFSTFFKKEKKTFASFSINIIIIKEDGTQTEKTLESVDAVKSSQGWLIGSE